MVSLSLSLTVYGEAVNYSTAKGRARVQLTIAARGRLGIAGGTHEQFPVNTN